MYVVVKVVAVAAGAAIAVVVVAVAAVVVTLAPALTAAVPLAYGKSIFFRTLSLSIILLASCSGSRIDFSTATAPGLVSINLREST
jgi:hypothetical protein